jgi:hypothetical protein
MVLRFLRGLVKDKAAKADSATRAESVSYAGYTIEPTPRQVERGWTTEGNISKEISGVLKSQHFIRVDTHGDRNDAITLAIQKAKKIIDEQGDALFNGN